MLVGFVFFTCLQVKGNPDRGDDEDTLELVEDKELVIEEEEVANRIQHRKVRV